MVIRPAPGTAAAPMEAAVAVMLKSNQIKTFYSALKLGLHFGYVYKI